MKVRISDPGGHSVEVEADHTDLTYVIERTRELYESTRPVGPMDSGRVGFVMPDEAQNGSLRPAYVTLPRERGRVGTPATQKPAERLSER